MLREITKLALYEETRRLMGAMGLGEGELSIYLTEGTSTTGRAWQGTGRVHLSVPRHASIPQALALIVHEVAHVMTPGEKHGQKWRRAVNRCLACYDAGPIERRGTKAQIHARARQALAERLRCAQVGPAPTRSPDPKPRELPSHRREAVLGKIAKALALAKRAGSEEEASTAARTASRLLSQYRLTMEDVTQAERDLGDPMTDRWVHMGTRAHSVHWRVRLGFDLAEVMGCFCLKYGYHYDSETNKAGPAMRFFGRSSAVESAAYLYSYLIREIAQLGKEAARQYARERKAYRKERESFSRDERTELESRFYASTHIWGASYRLGCVKGVVAKIREENQREEKAYRERLAQDVRCTSMTLVDRDADEAEKWARSTVRVGGSYRSHRRHSYSASTAGRNAGRNLSVHRGMATGSGPKMLTSG